MVAGQRLPPARARRPQLVHPDPLPQQHADLLVGDGRVGQHRQDHIHQQMPGLTAAGPLGEFLLGPRLRPRFARRDRLVEQRHDLIQLVGRGLGHQRQQDGIPPLRIPAFQRLVGRPAAHRGQEPAPLGWQHRQIQPVRVHAAQIDQLLDRRLHRRRCRVHRRRRQPRQPGHPQPRVDPQQPVQIPAHLAGQQMLHQFPRQRPGGGPRRGDHLRQDHHPGPDRLRRDQVLGRHGEQQPR